MFSVYPVHEVFKQYPVIRFHLLVSQAGYWLDNFQLQAANIEPVYLFLVIHEMKKVKHELVSVEYFKVEPPLTTIDVFLLVRGRVLGLDVMNHVAVNDVSAPANVHLPESRLKHLV